MRAVKLKVTIQGLGFEGDVVRVTADYAGRLVAAGAAEPATDEEAALARDAAGGV